MLQCKIGQVKTLDDGSISFKARDVEGSLYEEGSVEVPTYNVTISDPITRSWLEHAISSNNFSVMEGKKIDVDAKNQMFRILTNVTARITATRLAPKHLAIASVTSVEKLSEDSDASGYKLICGPYEVILSEDDAKFLAFGHRSGSPESLCGIECYIGMSDELFAVKVEMAATITSAFEKMVSPR